MVVQDRPQYLDRGGGVVMTPRQGDRVRIRIAIAKGWAQGAVAAMDGREGVVVEDASVNPRSGLLLVRFVGAPVKGWWSGQSDPLCWHFDASELEVIAAR